MVTKAENILCKAAVLLAGAVSMISCQKHPVFEDQGNCEDVVEVYLKYDYNIQRADMRPFHVGWASVYAIDDKGNVAAVKTVSPAEAADKNSTVKFDGLQPGRYTFAAMAMQSPYETLAQGQGARFRATFPAVGSAISDLTVKLDRNAVPGSEVCAVDAPVNGLDTLWIGRSINAQGVIMPEEVDQRGNVICDTISLVRDTKYLHLTLHQLGERENIHDTDFEVYVTDANGYLQWDNNLMKDSELVYTPHASWTTAMSEKGLVYYSDEEASHAPADDPIVERAAHFDISFSRLMYNMAGSGMKNAELLIVNKETGDAAVRINLPYYLGFGKDAFSICHYSEQEYLDREYDYHMDFFLQQGMWAFLQLKVNTTPWTKRFQRVEL